MFRVWAIYDSKNEATNYSNLHAVYVDRVKALEQARYLNKMHVMYGEPERFYMVSWWVIGDAGTITEE